LAIALLICGAEAKSSGTSSAVSSDPTATMTNDYVYTITVLHSADRPPFSEFNEHGLSGFEVDLLAAICEEAGMTCNTVLAALTEAWASHSKGYMGTGLLNHNFDCATSIGNARARKSGLLFSHPYTTAEAGLMLVKDAATWANSTGKVIGVVLGSSCDSQVAKQLAPSAKLEVSFEDGQKLMQALQDSIVDAALVCGDDYAYRLSDNMTTAEVAERFEDVSEGLSIICHPKKAMQMELLNLGLSAFRVKDSGLALQRLCNQWNVSCEYHRTEGTSPPELSSVTFPSRLAFLSVLTWLRWS